MTKTPVTSAAGRSPGGMGLRTVDFRRVRDEFPLLKHKLHGQPIAYLDSAASTQKPRVVLDAMTRFYEEDYANVHRGVHTLSERATRAFEAARERVRAFIGARSSEEIVFTRGTTESINLVAQSWGRRNVGAGDEILLTALEHHSNIVPWQMLCAEQGARIRVLPMHDSGELDLASLDSLLGPRTRLLALAHVSNALGTLNPVRELVAAAHAKGIPVLIDGAQAVAHLRVDVCALDADFYAFSSHKLYGPTGIGVLYGKRALLEAMPPWQGGGDMIRSVSFEKSTYNALPWRFEAGTPAIAEAIGLAAAIDWLCEIGVETAAAWEDQLLAYAAAEIGALPGLRLIGTAPRKASVLSFLVAGIHPHDLGTVLDREGVAIRAGHHCAQPVMERLGIPATARASFAVYNNRDDVDALVAAVKKAQEMFA